MTGSKTQKKRNGDEGTGRKHGGPTGSVGDENLAKRRKEKRIRTK